MGDTTASNDADLAKPLSELRSVLIPGETLEAFAVQRRVFALLHRRTLVAATSGRLVVLTAGCSAASTWPPSAGRTWRKSPCGSA
jgi:hypothetical protein